MDFGTSKLLWLWESDSQKTDKIPNQSVMAVGLSHLWVAVYHLSKVRGPMGKSIQYKDKTLFVDYGDKTRDC